jgi:Protein of unknown function (DUF3253)
MCCNHSDSIRGVITMNARDATLALLASRAEETTICPSEVARVLASRDGLTRPWRDKMPEVHAAVDRLLKDGMIQLSWKGRVLAERSGPYRIGVDGIGSDQGALA